MVANTGCNWATQTPFGCKVNRIVAGNNPPFKQAEWRRINGVDWVHYQAWQSRYNRVENIDFSLAGPLSSYQLRSWIAGHIMILGQTENTRSGQLWPVYVNPWGG